MSKLFKLVMLISITAIFTAGNAVADVSTYKFKNAEAAGVAQAIGDSLNDLQIAIYENTNTIIFNGSAATVKNALTIAKSLDVAQPQIEVNVVICQIDLEKMKSIGSNFIPRAAGAGFGNEFSFFTASMFQGIDPFSNGTFVGWTNDFAVMIEAMAKNDVLEVLSAPTLITSNNSMGRIAVGRNIAFPTGKTSIHSEDGITVKEYSEYVYQDTGLTLSVIPRVRNNSINLEIVQELKHASFAEVPVDNEFKLLGLIPVLTTTKLERDSTPTTDITVLQTDVNIPSGKSVAIGGLIRTMSEKNVSKVPLLGDIPILGYLFKTEDIKDHKTELVLFVTAKLINTPQDLKDDSETVSSKMSAVPADEKFTKTVFDRK